MAAIIETRHLTHISNAGMPDATTALEDVSFAVEEGDFVGIIGSTGSGKSTLITHFNGILKPTSGQVLLDGKDIWAKGQDIRKVRFSVGLVFQYPEYQLFEETIYKDIAFGPKNMGLSEEEIDRRVRRAAAFTGLPEEYLERSPFELSGGQKRRVAIAGVLAMEPRVLVLDEPEDVSFAVEEGDFVGIIGSTGSGKSTLITHFNGILKPTSGQVLLDGKDIWAKGQDIRKVRFAVGLVFQYPEYQLFEETIYKDIAFGPKNMGLSEEEIDRRVRRAAAFTGLPEEYLERSPFELSGGQKRRVAIAGVLAMEPRVLVLDEPAAGLDPEGRDMILSQVKRYHKETGTTVLLVSHSRA